MADTGRQLADLLFKGSNESGGSSPQSVRFSENPDAMRMELDRKKSIGESIVGGGARGAAMRAILGMDLPENATPFEREVYSNTTAATNTPGPLALAVAPAAFVRGAKGAKETAKGGKRVADIVRNPALEVPAAIRTPEAVQLTGALRPAEAPVRGQTSRELLRAQKRELTDDQKELLERLKQSNPEFASAVKFMTPQEVGKIISNPAGVRQLETLLQVLPSAKELASVAKAGTPKQGWYRASTQAIMDVFGVEDAPRFASLLAALSPQTSVEMNLLNTLNVWKNWTAAGRPTDPRDIKRIMGASVAGTKGEESVLEAWTNNAMRSLSAPDPTKVTLSGPKVDSFYRNLADDVYRVTNDAWMASGLGVGQDLFSGSPTALQIARGDPGLSPGYIGTSARMREAGQMANILPSEAQETTWSLFMPLYETARSMGISPREVLQRGLLTPELIRGTPDFATLLTQGKYGDILRGAGYEEQLSRLRPTEFSRGAPDLSLSEQRDLERAAKRLEDLRELRGMESRARMISLPSGASYPENAFAYGTYEAIPGRGLGHLEGLIDEPMGTRQYFSSRVSGAFRDPQGRDVLQSSLGLNPIATRGMTGAYRPETEIPFQGTLREPATGRAPLEVNPGFATGVEVPVTRSGDIPERIKRELTAAEAARGYMTAQRGSPWNAQIPSERGESLFVPLEKKADPERMGMTTALTGGEYGLADTGAGTAVLNWGKPLSLEEQTQLKNYLGGQRGVTTKNVSDYVDMSKAFEAGEGSGEATRQLLDILSRLPENKRSALSEAMRRPAGELADIYEKAAQTRNESVRQDLMRGLRIIQKAGIPGLAAALAAGEALAEEQPTGALPAGR